MKMNQKAKQLICVLLCGLLLLATTPVCLPTAQAETGGSADAAFAAAFNDLSWMYYGDGYFFTEATDPKAEFVNKFLLHTRVLEQYAPDGADEFTVSAELYENHAFTYFQETDTLRAALRQQSIYNDGVYSSYIGGWGGPAVNFVYNSYADLGENGYEVYSFILWTYENDMTADDPGDEYTPSADDVEGVDYIVFQYDWDPDTDVYGKIVGGVKSKVVYDGTAPVKYLSIEQMSSSDFLALIKEKCTAHCYTDADDTTCNVCYEVRSAESDETPDCSTISGYVPTVDIIRDPGYWEADYATAVDVVSAASGKGVTVSFSGAGNQSFHTYCTQTYNLDGLHLSLRNLTGNGFSVAFFGYTDDVDFSGNALRFINYASGSVVLPKHPFDSTIEMNTDIAPFTTDVDIKIKQLDNGDWEYNINGDAIILTDEFVTGLVGDTSAVRVQFFENVWVHSAMGAHSFDVVALHNGLCADELAAEEHEKKEIADTIAGDSEVHKVSADDFNGNYDYDDRVQWADNADGGVHCSITAFETATLGVNYLQQLSLNGAHVVVSDLKAADNFTLILGQTPSDYAGNYPDRSLVRFSADGSVIVYPSPVGDVIIAGSDAVKAMLTGTTTLLSFAVSDDGTVSLTVVNEAGVSTGVFTAYGEQWTDRTKAYIAFVGAFVRESLEFDILAIHGGDELCGTEQYEKVIRPVIDLIAAIGEVTLESGSAIEAAEAAYAALTDAQKALVENYDVLTAARAQYDALVAAAEKEAADKAAAAEVDALISAIGTVTLESGDAIEAAEDAYAALTDAQKALVTKKADLDAARAEYEELALAATLFAGGEGTEDNPYLISNAEQLSNVRLCLDAHFKLLNDIIFTDADFAEGGAFYNGGAGWMPIGADDNAFAGVFDGNGYAVKNLYINISSSDTVYAGLFACNTGTIKNLGVEISEVSVEATPFDCAGGIAGRNFGTITNCYNTGSVGGAYAGGIVGENFGTVTNCYNTGSVSATLFFASPDASGGGVAVAGGVAGRNDGTVTNCYNTGSVSAVSSESDVGGIVGENFGTVTDCYNTGSVSATSSESCVGGIAGGNGGTVTDCYNTGDVSGTYAGGIAGYNSSDGTITNCYYYEGSASGVGSGTDACTKCTLSQLQQQTTFVGFDFKTVWVIKSEGYLFPQLRSNVHCDVADKAAAAEVDALITAIGTVTLESGSAIEAAEAAYAALTDAQKALVENYDVLTAARAEYDVLVNQENNLIKSDTGITNVIGAVTYEDGVVSVPGDITQLGTFTGVLLSPDKAYSYRFTLTIPEASTYSIRIPIRFTDYNSDGYADKGQCLSLFPDIAVLSYDYWGEYPFYKTESATSQVTFAMQPGTAYDFEIVTTATAVTVYVDGEKLIEAAGSKIAEDTSIGFGGWSTAYTASDIMLQEVPAQRIADEEAAAEVDALITAIGTVTLESGDAIEAAETALAALEDYRQLLVTKRMVLNNARAEYDALVAEKEAADKAAAAEVDALITAIGTVTLESGDAIEAAEEAYAALTADQKACVTKRATLERVRAEYSALVAAAEKEAADKAAAAEVDALISAIGTVTLESGDAIEAAEDAYAALTDAQKAKVTKTAELDAARAEYDALVAAAEKEAADKAAAKVFDDMVANLGEITLESGDAIQAAYDSYAALTADQKKLVTKMAELDAAYCEYTILVEQDEADKAAAAEVDALITAIGAVTLESGDAIEAAEDAYAALTDAQKAKVTQKTELDAARAEYDALVAEKEAADKAAAKAVDDRIQYVSAMITLESGPAIKEVEDAYAALTDDQKKLVTMRAYLTAARVQYDALVKQDEADKAAAAEVDALITAIGTVTLESGDAIEAAEDAYAALTDAQKAKVTQKTELDAARAEYDALVAEKEAADKAAAKAVDDRIQYVSAMITLESGPAIKEVEDAYAALTDDQKKLVTMRAYLTAARVQYDALVKQDEADKAAAADVDALITAIGAVTLESGDAIEAAEDAYAALTDAQKAKVTQKTELDAARAQYDALVAEKEAADKAAAKAFDNMVANLGEITLESGDAIQAAYDSYAALTADQKKLVTKMTELDAAYCEYTILVEQEEADKAAAADVDALITAIGAVTLESKAAIEAAEDAYAALTDAQKAKVTQKTELDAARARYNALIVEWNILNDSGSHKVSSNNFNGNDAQQVIDGHIQWQNNADGGVHCSVDAFDQAYKGINYLRELSLDGAHIVVSNLNSGPFALFLGKAPSDGTVDTIGRSTILFDTNGNVFNPQWGSVVISDSGAVRDMFAGTTTLLAFAVSDDGTVSLTVANEVEQSTGALIAYDEQWTDHTKAYVAFVSAFAGGFVDFDVLAIHGGNEACGEEQYEKVIRPVIELIDAIGEVTLDSGDAIKAAEEAYTSLTKAQKKFVANYEVLAAARRTYAGMVLFDGGDGTAERPLLISTKAQLDCVRLYPYAHFKLLNDIVFTEADFAEGGAFYNGGAGWTPIGTVDDPFTGVFDGNGHTIKNLYICVVDHTDYLDNGPVCVGLFGCVLSGTVKNLGMVNSSITAEVSNTWCCIGSIVGYLADGTVSGCYSMGTVSTEGHYSEVGGIVGKVSGCSTVSDCYNAGNVSSVGDRVGGIAGSVDGLGSTISGCYNVGAVSVSNNGSHYAGGIVGTTAGYATVTDCYNAGSVNGDYAGGIVGTTHGYTIVTNCYNVGSLNGDWVGGIVGELTYGTFTNCYYLNTVQQGAQEGQNACTYEQMRQQETFQGFDFDAVWFINDGSDGFPQLRNIPHFMPVSVTITQLPDTLTYFEGDSLDLAGMILTVTYNNGANGIVTDYTVSGYDPTPGIKVITVTYGGKTATFEVEVIAKAMVGITITKQPDKLIYLEGGSLDLTGMVVTGIHNNGTSEIVTDYTVSGYTSTPGIKVITVTFGGLTATFEVEVIAKSPVSITVTKQPDKLVYLEGDSFSKAGLEVTVNYDNGTSELVTDYTVSGYDPTPGVKTVTVTFGGLTTSFEVEVIAKSLTSVIVVKQPAKLTYLEGESFDGAGMVVAAIYDNNVMEMVTAYIVSGYDSTPGTKTITVSFGGFTDTFTVVVNAAKEEETVVGEQLREELSTTKPGETVTLEGDAKVEQLMIPAGVTLDLNGHTLEGDYLAFFGNVEGGTIKAPKDHVVFLANNTKLPVWNGEEYVLVEAPTFQHLYTVKNNTLTYTFLPTFDASIHALLAAGGEASNVTVTVQMSWSPSSGGTASQNFVFADKFVKTVIDSYKNGRYGQVFTITLSNAAALTNLQYSAVVSSGTGASFAPDTPAPKV